MKRYIVNITNGDNITSIADVLMIKRDTSGTDKGLTIEIQLSASTATEFHEISDWSSRSLPNDYNDSSLYIYNRAVAEVAGSTNDNTLITNDGIVAVYRAPNVIEVIDLFDQDSDIYEDINPNGYEQLSGYSEITNPINKRVFIVYDKNGDNVMWIKNLLQFINNDEYHFSSELDYDLPLDEYGYYITDLTNWTSTYSETSNFQFYKKTYFKIESSDTITITLLNNEEAVVKEESGNISTLKFLSIDETDKFIYFKISFATENNGYIIIN